MKKARYTESQIFKILKEAESGIAAGNCYQAGVLVIFDLADLLSLSAQALR